MIIEMAKQTALNGFRAFGRWLTPLVLAAGFSFIGAGPANAEAYLYDLLKRPAYKASFDALLRRQKVDRWLARYSRDFDGPSVPVTMIDTVEGPREVGFVCKRHSCGDNRFFVLFTEGGETAVGMLLKDASTPRFFGRPTDSERQALLAAAK
ncbi:MAG: Ivy family c-type lysozyme inhibitor [Beijerinckiaceae bacterium]